MHLFGTLAGVAPVWEQPECIALNRLPMRVPLTSYPSADAARAGEPSQWRMTLDGTWRFKLVDSPSRGAGGFYGPRVRRLRVGRHSRAGNLGAPGPRSSALHERGDAVSVRAAAYAGAQPDRAVSAIVHAARGVARPTRGPSRRLGRQRAAGVRQRRLRRTVEGLAAAGGIRSNVACEARRQRAGRNGHPLVRRQLHRRPGSMVATRSSSQRRVVQHRLRVHPGPAPDGGAERRSEGGPAHDRR